MSKITIPFFFLFLLSATPTSHSLILEVQLKIANHQFKRKNKNICKSLREILLMFTQTLSFFFADLKQYIKQEKEENTNKYRKSSCCIDEDERKKKKLFHSKKRTQLIAAKMISREVKKKVLSNKYKCKN